jgi:hypothetical protein
MKRLVFLTSLALVLGLTPVAHAALVNNGGGLIYDTDRNITWYDAPAVLMNWTQALSWAASLDVSGVSGWRLPSARNIDGSGPCYGLNCTGSEMGHLYYLELGNQPNYDAHNTGPFQNLLASSPEIYAYYKIYIAYWTGEEVTTAPGNAWSFSFTNGDQNQTNTGDVGPEGEGPYALAVHEGNIGAPVPIPGAVWLLGSGLVGLVAIRRRFKK